MSFFYLHIITLSTDIRVHRAGSQLKIISPLDPPFWPHWALSSTCCFTLGYLAYIFPPVACAIIPVDVTWSSSWHVLTAHLPQGCVRTEIWAIHPVSGFEISLACHVYSYGTQKDLFKPILLSWKLRYRVDQKMPHFSVSSGIGLQIKTTPSICMANGIS